MKKSVIIIGAGLAGLAAGCYAQINGYQSHILEHHSVPGGVAATWKRKGYTIDGGIHFVTGYKPGTALYKLFQELGIIEANPIIEVNDYGSYIDEKRGQKFHISRDIEKLRNDLISSYPEDSTVINELIAGVNSLRGYDLSSWGMDKPPELIGKTYIMRQMLAMRKVLKYFTGPFALSVEEYCRGINNNSFKNLLKSLFSPEVPVWFILMLLSLLAEGQLGLLEKGCLPFVRSIEQRYHELGGEITYNATVEKIIVEHNKASGVMLKDETEYGADVVVSAADGYNTIFNLLAGRYVNEPILNRYRNWKLYNPFIMINFGIDKEYEKKEPFSTVMLSSPIELNHQKIDHFYIRNLNYSREFAPEGKTLLQVSIESEWDYWANLRKTDQTQYNQEKMRIAEEVLKRLELYYPGIKGKTEVIDVATPYTFWRYTFNHQGSWGGWALTPEVTQESVFRTLPGLHNFFMAGQWVMPGGGVPACLYSGRHVVQILCAQEKRRFKTK